MCSLNAGDRFSPYRMFVGSFIPNALMEYQGITASAKLAWARLAQYAGEEGRAWPKEQTLAEKLGMSESTVRRSLKELVTGGFIAVETPEGTDRLNHMSNSYYFLWHPIFEAAMGLSGGEGVKLAPPLDSPGPVNLTGPVRSKRPVPSSSEENQFQESQKTPPPPTSSSESGETEGGGGITSVLEETEGKNILAGAGVSQTVIGTIIRKVGLDEIRRKRAQFRQAVLTGANIGPGVLVHALLNGVEIEMPVEPAGKASGPGVHWFSVKCRACGVDDVRIARSREDLQNICPTCRKCHERMDIGAEVPDAEIEVPVTPLKRSVKVPGAGYLEGVTT